MKKVRFNKREKRTSGDWKDNQRQRGNEDRKTGVVERRRCDVKTGVTTLTKENRKKREKYLSLKGHAFWNVVWLTDSKSAFPISLCTHHLKAGIHVESMTAHAVEHNRIEILWPAWDTADCSMWSFFKHDRGAQIVRSMNIVQVCVDVPYFLPEWFELVPPLPRSRNGSVCVLFCILICWRLWFFHGFKKRMNTWLFCWFCCFRFWFSHNEKIIQFVCVQWQLPGSPVVQLQ